MKYRDTFDRLGIPVARPADSFDIEGVYIILGCILAAIIVTLWIRN